MHLLSGQRRLLSPPDAPAQGNIGEQVLPGAVGRRGKGTGRPGNRRDAHGGRHVPLGDGDGGRGGGGRGAGGLRAQA